MNSDLSFVYYRTCYYLSAIGVVFLNDQKAKRDQRGDRYPYETTSGCNLYWVQLATKKLWLVVPRDIACNPPVLVRLSLVLSSSD